MMYRIAVGQNVVFCNRIRSAWRMWWAGVRDSRNGFPFPRVTIYLSPCAWRGVR